MKALDTVNPELQVKETVGMQPTKGEMAYPPESRRRLGAFALFVIVLTLCFFQPLLDLAKYATEASLYSHIFLVPLISAYLVWLRRDRVHHYLTLPRSHGLTVWRYPLVPLLLAFVVLGAYLIAKAQGLSIARNDYLSMTAFSYVCLVFAGSLFFLGYGLIRLLAFPMAFLLFMVPFPSIVAQWIEIFFQYTSTFAAQALFIVSGTPVLRQDTVFHLPGLVLRVAEECSGIRSSLVLFMTSLLAGYLFLHRPWKRSLLALVVIPLGIVRNAFRIFTIAMLCMHVDPNIINSALHRRGGPLFFVLSLIPFFVILLFLWKSERKRKTETLQ